MMQTEGIWIIHSLLTRLVTEIHVSHLPFAAVAAKFQLRRWRIDEANLSVYIFQLVGEVIREHLYYLYAAENRSQSAHL